MWFVFLVSVSVACAGCGPCSVPGCEVRSDPLQSGNAVFVCLF